MNIPIGWENSVESKLAEVSILEIDEMGTIRCLGTPPVELGEYSVKRASHILPVHPLKRLSFGILRAVFGERGKIAAWTRTWYGPWQAVLCKNGETFTAQSRKVCLKWERERLREIGY